MDSQIEKAMRRVPRLNGVFRYVPLNQLPQGTEVHFTALESKGGELREVNNNPEVDVFHLPEGKYTLEITDWPTVLLTNGTHTLLVKPLYNLLAPSSTFQANTQLPNPAYGREEALMKNYRLTSGKITLVSLFNYQLTE